MIKYQLLCKKGHEFDGWFRNSAAFDEQADKGLVTCPECGSKKVTKALMAPNVSTSRSKAKASSEAMAQGMDTVSGAGGAGSAHAQEGAHASAGGEHVGGSSGGGHAEAGAEQKRGAPQEEISLQMPEEMRAQLRNLRKEVLEKTEDVGKGFADEARKIHNDESENRPIRGEATLDEARELNEEGIDFFPIPELPEDKN